MKSTEVANEHNFRRNSQKCQKKTRSFLPPLLGFKELQVLVKVLVLSRLIIMIMNEICFDQFLWSRKNKTTSFIIIVMRRNSTKTCSFSTTKIDQNISNCIPSSLHGMNFMSTVFMNTFHSPLSWRQNLSDCQKATPSPQCQTPHPYPTELTALKKTNSTPQRR